MAKSVAVEIVEEEPPVIPKDAPAPTASALAAVQRELGPSQDAHPKAMKHSSTAPGLADKVVIESDGVQSYQPVITGDLASFAAARRGITLPGGLAGSLEPSAT